MAGSSALTLAGAISVALLPDAALAQAAVAPPTREEIQPFQAAPPPPRAKLAVEGDIERSPCALGDAAYADVKVTLTAATFNNLGPVTAEELAPAWQPFAGTARPISVVCDIRDAAATILRRKGYLAAVQVPTQRIEGGQVRFEILYAKLTAVRVRGDAGRSEALIARYLAPLAQGQVFNRFAAERALLLARDIPGFDVRLALKPAGGAPGEMIGEVSVRRTPFEVDFNIQNYAAHETGPWNGQVRAQFYGLTGLGDRTTLSVNSTLDFSEQQIVSVGHDMAIGGSGLRLGGNFTYAWTHPGLGDAVPEVRARSLFANLEATYPVVRTQAASLSAALGFDLVNQDVDFGGGPLSRDRLRVGYARFDGDAVDLRGVGPGGTIGWHLQGSLELRRGFDVFGASPNCVARPVACSGATFVPPSLVDGDPTATVVRFSGLAEVRVARRLSVALLPRAQVASAALFSFEQLSAGNYTVGRGYAPATLSGDSGVGFAAEARFDRFRVLSKVDLAAAPFLFVDSAWVWNRNSLPGVDPERLVSVGAGARVSWAERARLDMTLAVPVRDAGRVRSGDVRFLVSLTTRLLPWRAR